MRRILVIGNAGAGKTSVAQLLASQRCLPYIGLDRIVWKPGWVKTSTLERQEKESAIADTPTWVVDGVSLLILGAADTVILLDYPRYKCFWRAIRRNIPYLFRSRPGLPERCPEISIVPVLFKIIWQFPKKVRPKILSECHNRGKRIVQIRSNKDLERFLSSVARA
jgi:adenylate kinase family enzyme